MVIKKSDFFTFKKTFHSEEIAALAWQSSRLSGNGERIFSNLAGKALNILVNECRKELISDILMLCKTSRTKAAIDLRKRLIFVVCGFDGIDEKAGKSVYLIPPIKDKDLILIKSLDRAKTTPRLKLVKAGVAIQYVKKDKAEKNPVKVVTDLVGGMSEKQLAAITKAIAERVKALEAEKKVKAETTKKAA